MKITIEPRIYKKVMKLPPQDRDRLLNALAALEQNPESQSKNLARLRGREEFRFRVGDWRVIYRQEHNTLRVIDVLRRNERTY